MSVGFRATGSSTSEERASAVPPASSPFAQDLALAQGAAAQEARAQKQLAQRLIVRTRRAAHALMAGSTDADDAALHALIEILRTVHAYAGNVSLEAWADRLTARSVVRFARAVRTRTGQAEASELEGQERTELSARTLEEFLRRLPRLPREALFLREGLGFDLAETAQLVRVSRRSLREQLTRARESAYVRAASKDARGEVSGLPPNVESWFLFRDREGSLVQGPTEREQQQGLELDPQVQLMMKELRELSLFLDSVRSGRLSSRDRKLVQEALSAVRVASAVERDSTLPAEAGEESEPREQGQPESSPWFPRLTHGLSGLLVVGSFVALAFHVPTPRRAQRPLAAAARSAGPSPTVEVLSIAHTAQNHGGRLERAGETVGEGAMREGDVVTARARPGCFVMEPEADVCLAPSSAARIVHLGSARRIELQHGRAVVSVAGIPSGAPFQISVGVLHAQTSDGVLGIELDGGLVIVRVLRGTARVFTDDGGHEAQLTSARSALFRLQSQNLEIAPQLLEKARRDWDLLAARTQGATSPRPQGSLAGRVTALGVSAPAALQTGLQPPSDPLAAEQGAAVAEQAVAPTEASDAAAAAPAEVDPSTARTLAGDARAFARNQRWNDAANSYEQLIHDYPRSEEAREALVLLGELQLQHLAMPEEALATFDRYLSSGGGNFDLRARYGRILALRRLGRVPEEQASVAQFLNLYRTTPQARVLLSSSEPNDSARTQ